MTEHDAREGSAISSNDLIALGWLSRGAVRDPMRSPDGSITDHATFPISNVYVRQQLVEAEICPECGHDLDTGWECTECNADFRAFFVR